jgi:hypothetical protein
MSAYTPKAKRAITPFSITLTLEAHRINESGTFLSFEVKKAPKGVKVSQPPQGGGALYIRLDDAMTLKDAGVTILDEGAVSKAPVTRKLF